MYTFIFRPTQKSFRLRNFHEIEEILTLTQYFYEHVHKVQEILTIYITCNQ